MIVVPASSAPIEHTFFVAGYCCIGKWNRLTNMNLEREVLIKTNSLTIFNRHIRVVCKYYNNNIK